LLDVRQLLDEDYTAVFSFELAAKAAVFMFIQQAALAQVRLSSIRKAVLMFNEA